MLMIPGYSPKDLAEAEKKRKEEAIQRILDTPLTDEQISQARESLNRKYLADLEMMHEPARKRVAEGQTARIEQVDDQNWIVDIPLNRPQKPDRVYKEIAGPVIRPVDDKKFPLKAIFTVRYKDDFDGKDRAETHVYRYDKLSGHWGRDYRAVDGRR